LNWYHKKPLGVLAASILFLVMVIGTSLLARNSFVLQQQAKEIEFQSTATSIENKLRQRLLAYEHILRSGVGYLRAADAVTRDQWREFVESLRLQEHYRGIQGIGYAQWLTPEEVPILEQRIRAEGFEDFKV